MASSNIHSSASSLFLKSVSQQQQFCFYSRVKKEQETPATKPEKEEGSVPTVPIPKPNSIEQQVKQILAFNSEGQVAEAVEGYEKLKKMTKHIDLKTLNAIVSSFAPKKLLFKWFKPYKDYVDMYVEASKFRPKEVCTLCLFGIPISNYYFIYIFIKIIFVLMMMTMTVTF